MSNVDGLRGILKFHNVWLHFEKFILAEAREPCGIQVGNGPF